jgi:hypothetical protein
VKKKNQDRGYPALGGGRVISKEEIGDLDRWAARTLRKNHGPSRRSRAAAWLRRRTWTEIIAFLAMVATWTTIALYLRVPGGSWGGELGEGAVASTFLGDGPRGRESTRCTQ